ncbi:hypothetical protein HPB50_002173 [Hyalomma asiaticum]|uniref:Uncharacterized protein n=1 Tax=Hyalomma asiaticum TaxID=266040 RepID=A0ACB7RLY8_HYAAI|nr:hypothetical protein HPB50_002173 [Hyalomma asiaticum]
MERRTRRKRKRQPPPHITRFFMLAPSFTALILAQSKAPPQRPGLQGEKTLGEQKAAIVLKASGLAFGPRRRPCVATQPGVNGSLRGAALETENDMPTAGRRRGRKPASVGLCCFLEEHGRCQLDSKTQNYGGIIRLQSGQMRTIHGDRVEACRRVMKPLQIGTAPATLVHSGSGSGNTATESTRRAVISDKKSVDYMPPRSDPHANTFPCRFVPAHKTIPSSAAATTPPVPSGSSRRCLKLPLFPLLLPLAPRKQRGKRTKVSSSRMPAHPSFPLSVVDPAFPLSLFLSFSRQYDALVRSTYTPMSRYQGHVPPPEVPPSPATLYPFSSSVTSLI